MSTRRIEIVEVKRLRNSINGQPRLRLAVRINGTDGQQFLNTAVNAHFLGEIVWDNVQPGQMWTIKIGPRGTVIDMWK